MPCNDSDSAHWNTLTASTVMFDVNRKIVHGTLMTSANANDGKTDTTVKCSLRGLCNTAALLA